MEKSILYAKIAVSQIFFFQNSVLNIICVASLQKGPHVAKIKKNEIFLDLNRAGRDKSVKKKISVLAQIYTKLWSIYELHNFINYISIKKKIIYSLDLKKKYIE